ncbi:hypothetical protein BDW72DRAFT_208933 [Aspergillus terricola var. indicus]
MRAVAQFGQALNVWAIDRPVPAILNSTDVVVRLNASAICGSDLHSYRTSSGSPEHPFLYGHEGIGHVVEVGDSVQFFSVGDYVVIPDNFDNGHFTLEPDTYVPSLGIKCGCEAEYARIPFADNSLIPVPITDTTNTSTLIDYLFASDIFATAWSGVTWSAAYSALLRGASRVYSVDRVQDRFDLAASIGAIPINFGESDPVEQILALEPNGVRRGVEAVGYEAVDASGVVQSGIILRQLIDVTAQRGGIGVVGLFSSGQADIDYGAAYVKKVASEIVPLITSGQAHPSFIVSSVIGIEEAPEYFGRFNRTEESKAVITF